MAAFGVLVFSASQNLRSSSPAAVTLDLHPHGFPTGKERMDAKAGVFYLSGNRLAVFFNYKLPSLGQESHAFQLLVLDTDGHILAEREIQAAPKAMDLVAGPNGVLLFDRVGKLDFFDADPHLLKTVALAESVTGISFSRRLNQLVETTIDDVSQTRSAHFLDGDTLEEKLSLSYPIKSKPDSHVGRNQQRPQVEPRRNGGVFGGHIAYHHRHLFSQKLVLFGVVERYLNKPVPACPIKVEVATAVRVTPCSS